MIWQVLWMIIIVWANDFAWARYIRRVAEGRAARAGWWAMMVYLSGIAMILNVLKDHWLILVAAAATFCGTSIAVQLDKRRKHGDG